MQYQNIDFSRKLLQMYRSVNHTINTGAQACWVCNFSSFIVERFTPKKTWFWEVPTNQIYTGSNWAHSKGILKPCILKKKLACNLLHNLKKIRKCPFIQKQKKYRFKVLTYFIYYYSYNYIVSIVSIILVTSIILAIFFF